MGLAGGVETMSKNPMAWEGGINPAIESSKQAQSCLMPMGITSENVAAKFGVDRYARVYLNFHIDCSRHMSSAPCPAISARYVIALHDPFRQ